MATITTTWTENQSITSFNAASLAAAGTTNGDIDLATSGYDIVTVQIKVIFGATPDGDVTIDILSSPDSGTSDDTIPLMTISIPETTSATKFITIPVKDIPFIQVKATNNDTTDTVNVSALYAGRKWTSA